MSPETTPLGPTTVVDELDATLPLLTGFFFSSRIFIMLLSVRVLGTDPQTGTAFSLALNFLLLAVVALCCIGSSVRSLRSIFALRPIRWVLGFLAFSCVSLSWTAAATLPAAIAYWLAMGADVAIVLMLVRGSAPTHAIHALMKGFVWGACVVAVIAWLLPAQSDLRLGDEELLGPNQIGFLCAFALLFAQYLLRRRLGRFVLPAILLAVTLLRTISKTTILAFALAELFFVLRDKSLSRKSRVLLVSAAALIALLFSSLFVSYFDIYANSGNSPETLTGRLGIWSVILSEAMLRPWIGHGFYSVWKVIPAFGEFEARHAHNELLQQFYLYGIVGIVLICGLYGSFYRYVRSHAPPLRTFFSSLLLFILIRGLADTDAIDLSLPLWAITMFTVLLEHATTSEPEMNCNEPHRSPSLNPVASGIL